jgi:hypothetical protein
MQRYAAPFAARLTHSASRRVRPQSVSLRAAKRLGVFVEVIGMEFALLKQKSNYYANLLNIYI